MVAFTDKLDIANRALQHLRKPRITSFSNSSKEAREIAVSYDRLREAELEKHLWRFSTRRVLLRPVGLDSITWTPPDWVAAAYGVGSIVSYTPTSGVNAGIANYWQAAAIKTIASTTTPDNDPDWRAYAGPVVFDLYDSGITYGPGELVLVPQEWDNVSTYSINGIARSGTTWYVSLQFPNTDHAVTDTDWWVPWSSSGRSAGDFGVTAGGVSVPLHYADFTVWLSLYSGNADNPVSATGTWVQMGDGTLANIHNLYPLGSFTETSAQCAYKLPYGFLRTAPTDPKADAYPTLGMPSGRVREDWVIENGYLVTTQPTTLLMRYVANLVNVRDFDPLFCELLAAVLAEELAPTLVDDPKLLPVLIANARAQYRKARRDAIATNSIEIGPIARYVDDLIAVR